MIRFACRLTRPGFALDTTFTAGQGVTALFGPSGSGKSTVIRLLAGLERPKEGRIAVGDTLLLDTGSGIAVPPHRRRMGLVFQDALLLPHLSVKANLTYGRWFTPRAERRITFDPVVEVLGIGHLLDRRPATLSGGERQRVAIGRALLASPRLLLMDEPLASLDQARRQEILPFIERLRDAFALPVVYVSHAVEEVTRLASHVVRLDAGRVVAEGTPADVFAAGREIPGSDRFALRSVLTARIRQRLPAYGVTLLDHPAGDIVVPGLLTAEAEVRLAIRATDVTLSRGATEGLSTRTVLGGTVTRIDPDAGGPFVTVTLTLTGGDVIIAAVTRLAAEALDLAPGVPVKALVKAGAIDESSLPGAVPTAQPG
ncbi:molybdenum ABC transporter ATP-binding protein [Phreatobacter sp.]|uniref:molybdenum ABC transporter ATP-binding protein n=1 Tax=Phreatobacter sp. TaxID=1966341 RepID=UPI0022BACC21|nr:molybdenum ABC transporter ATP-binding protein [Phreatobacter sp.]MCZ8316727.1 molybdenum ABC transporter ATP-binding protein [Phreatobacter sp.]